MLREREEGEEEGKEKESFKGEGALNIDFVMKLLITY